MSFFLSRFCNVLILIEFRLTLFSNNNSPMKVNQILKYALTQQQHGYSIRQQIKATVGKRRQLQCHMPDCEFSPTRRFRSSFLGLFKTFFQSLFGQDQERKMHPLTRVLPSFKQLTRVMTLSTSFVGREEDNTSLRVILKCLSIIIET